MTNRNPLPAAGLRQRVVARLCIRGPALTSYHEDRSDTGDDGPEESAASIQSLQSSVLSLSAISTAVSVSSSVLSILTAVLIAVRLGAQATGTVYTLTSIPTIASTVATLGFQTAAPYYVGRKQYDASTILSTALFLAASIGTALVIALLLGLGQLGKMFGNLPMFVAALVMSSALPQLAITYLREIVLSLRMVAAYAVARLSSPMIYLVGTAMFSGSGNAAITGVLGSYTVALFAACIATGTIVWWRHPFSLRPDGRLLHDGLRLGVLTHAGDLAQYLIFRIDQPLVGYMVGLQAAGYYAVAVRLAEVVWLLSSSLKTVVLSGIGAVSALAADEIAATATRLLLTASTIGGVLIVAMAALGLHLFQPALMPALGPLVVLEPGVIGAAASAVLIATLIGRGRPGIASILRLVALPASLPLYLILIRWNGATGAATASTVVYLAEFLGAVSLLARLASASVWSYVLPRTTDGRLVVLALKRSLGRWRGHSRMSEPRDTA